MSYRLYGQEVWKEDKICGLYKHTENGFRCQRQDTASLIAVLNRLEGPVAECTIKSLREIALKQLDLYPYPRENKIYIKNALDFYDEILFVLQGN